MSLYGFTKFLRGHAKGAAEAGAEIALTIEPAAEGGFFDGQVAGAQNVPGKVQPHHDQILVGGYAGFLLEQTGKVVRTQGKFLCQLFHGNILVQIAADIAHAVVDNGSAVGQPLVVSGENDAGQQIRYLLGQENIGGTGAGFIDAQQFSCISWVAG